MNLHPNLHCTCAGPFVCRTCDAFERWDATLSDAERGELALIFIGSLRTVHGVIRGEVKSRAPYLGQAATVEFDGEDAFAQFLFTHFCSLDSREAA